MTSAQEECRKGSLTARISAKYFMWQNRLNPRGTNGQTQKDGLLCTGFPKQKCSRFNIAFFPQAILNWGTNRNAPANKRWHKPISDRLWLALFGNFHVSPQFQRKMKWFVTRDRFKRSSTFPNYKCIPKTWLGRLGLNLLVFLLFPTLSWKFCFSSLSRFKVVTSGGVHSKMKRKREKEMGLS